MLDKPIEKEITVLEKYTEELIQAYNSLLMRHTNLKNDFNNIKRGQEIHQAKLDAAKNKLENLLIKLKNAEINNEQRTN